MAYRILAASGATAALAVGVMFAADSEVFKPSEITYVSPPDAPYAQLASATMGIETVASVATTSAEESSASPTSDNSTPSTSPPATEPEKAAPKMTSIEAPKAVVVPFTVVSGVQPSQSLAPSGAGGVPFTNFTLTAGDEDVIVHSVTVRGFGVGDVHALDSISLNDENGEDLSDAHFGTNSTAIFKDEFVVPAHTSKVMSIVGNMVDDVSPYEGQAPQLGVMAIDASAQLSGALPVIGTAQTINSTLTIGSATAELGEFDPGTDINRYIGDRNVRFAGIRVTASSQEDLSLSSITWRQDGTADSSDVTNISTYVNGSAHPTKIDGHDYTAAFSPAIVIPKGTSVQVYLAGDITWTGGARTLKFDIDSSDGIALTGNTYGYGVGIAADSNTSDTGNSVFITSDGTPDGDEGTPFYSAPLVTINGATMQTIEKAN